VIRNGNVEMLKITTDACTWSKSSDSAIDCSPSPRSVTSTSITHETRAEIDAWSTANYDGLVDDGATPTQKRRDLQRHEAPATTTGMSASTGSDGDQSTSAHSAESSGKMSTESMANSFYQLSFQPSDDEDASMVQYGDGAFPPLVGVS